MTNNILLSICITTYNMEAYIARAVESVLAQQVNFDYEIIVADDCSTDNTINILQQYQQRLGEKFIIVYSEKNEGLISNYVTSLKIAKGKYIASLDADDYWIDNNKLQKQAEILNNNDNIGYVHTNFYYENDSRSKRRLARSLRYRPSEKNIFIDNLLHYDIYLGSSCIRKSLLDFNELDIFVNKKFQAQDYPLFLSLSLKTKGYYLSEPTAICLFRTNSMSRQTDVLRNIRTKNKIFEIGNYFVAQYPIPAPKEALRKFRHKQSVLFTSWSSHDFSLVKHYAKDLTARQFLKYNPKALYIFIASKNKFLYKLFTPWVLRKRKVGE